MTQCLKRVMFWQIGPQQPVHLSQNYREGGIKSVYFVSKIQVYYILNFLQIISCCNSRIVVIVHLIQNVDFVSLIPHLLMKIHWPKMEVALKLTRAKLTLLNLVDVVRKTLLQVRNRHYF